MATDFFDRPIPGQSLTMEPGNNPWEQPSQYSDIEDVTKFYINSLANQEVLDDFGAMCSAGVPLAPIVESIYLQGVSRGIHTVDAGMLVAPIIHTFLKQALESMGITVKDTGADPKKRAEEKEMNRFRLMATKYLLEEGDDTDDPGKVMLRDIIDQEEESVQEEEPMDDMAPVETIEEEPTGLMARS
tara:strand:- start:1012 stop:1572 length:561 start_codon:yes stop_codon:yes gene_type:complete